MMFDIPIISFTAFVPADGNPDVVVRQISVVFDSMRIVFERAEAAEYPVIWWESVTADQGGREILWFTDWFDSWELARRIIGPGGITEREQLARDGSELLFIALSASPSLKSWLVNQPFFVNLRRLLDDHDQG